MNERFKYSLNGVYRCENFAEQVAQNDFPRVPIGSAGGLNGWYIKLVIKHQNNSAAVYPFISCDRKPTLQLRHFFNVIKKNESSCFERHGSLLTAPHQGLKGNHMNITDLLNQNNGYLDDDGVLTVVYGIHVDAIQGAFRMWKFNFDDQFFKPENALTIRHGDPEDGPLEVFYGHKQLLSFHSPYFRDHEARFRLSTLEKWRVEECLQVAHGVRVQLVKDCWISWIASYNELRNVVHYADLQLIERFWSPQNQLSKLLVFESCIEFGLRHYLAHLVRHFECLEDLKKMIQQLDMEKMSGEAMKTFAAKILKEKSEEIDRMVETVEGLGIEHE